MVDFTTGTFTVDADGKVDVDYLFDGGWFRGELAVFSLKGMEAYQPGSKEFIQEAARRALTNSPQGHILVQDEVEGAKLSADFAWERDFNTGKYQGVKAFNLTPGDEVALMLVQHTTVQKTWQNPNQTSQFGKIPIFSIPEANPSGSSSAESEVVDVDGQGTIAFEDVPIKQADKDYNDLIINLQGLDSNLPELSERINPNRDWRKKLVLVDEGLNVLSDDQLVMHLKLDETIKTKAADSAPHGQDNSGILRKGAKFSDGTVSLDGKNDLIAVQDSSDINQTTHAKRTISLWFKVDDKNSNQRQVIYEEGGVQQGDGGLNIYLENGRLYFGGWNQQQGKWSGTYLSSDQITSNTWHHVALVLDAQPGVSSSQPKALSGYLDGMKVGAGDGMELAAHQDNIGIGGLNETTQFHNGVAKKNSQYSLGGSLDDVRLYNRALSSAEISLLFNPNHDPVAVDEEFLTVEDRKVIILESSLLDNDTDIDQDSLSITAVTNGVNGTVALDQEGNAVFQPKLGFSGDASFQYTVSDGHGGSDTATVGVVVLPAIEPMPLGTNLHRLAAWSPELPFVNAFKFAQRWIPQDWGVTPKPTGGYEYIWDTGEFKQLDLDTKGWVKSLPAPADAPQYTSVSTLMFRDVGEYPSGKYVVLYEGEGTIKYGLDAQRDPSASTPGRDVIDVTPSHAGILLTITDTDPDGTGDYLRNIQVIPEKFEYAHDQTFNPEFLEKVQPFNTLRFMDWMATNNSQQSAWSDRPTPDSTIFSGEIASLESMVELANRTDSDPWFTIPHLATDEYITNFAKYVKDNLDPELKIYVEYSNEVWNNDFAQGWWIETQGKNEFLNSTAGDFTKRIDWYSKRTTEVTKIWDQVFDTNKERVIGVLGAQAANSWTAKRALQYAWSSTPLSHQASGIDAIAIAPYFGSYIGKPQYQEEIESWIDSDEPSLALDNLFKEITQGGVLSSSPTGGALQQSYNWTTSYAALAQQQGLELISYESGQHLNGTNGVQDNQAIGDLLIAANKDPRMGEIYQEYYQTLHELGSDLSLNYTDVSRYNKWGSWGTLENISQSNSPKYNAITNITTKVSHDLPPQLGKLNSNLSNLNIILEDELLHLNLNYTDIGLTDYHTVKIAWGDGSPVDLEKQEPLLGDIGKISGTHTYSAEGIYHPMVTVTDDDNLTTSKSLSIKVVKKIAIDWNPGENNSAIDLSGNGNIKVAILGMADFDVATIDPTTIRADDQQDALLDDHDVSTIGNKFRLIDINSDGLQDLEVTFRKSDLRTVIEENSEPFISDHQIYLFGSTSQLDSGLFFGRSN
jgi:hypothetical protein